MIIWLPPGSAVLVLAMRRERCSDIRAGPKVVSDRRVRPPGQAATLASLARNGIGFAGNAQPGENHEMIRVAFIVGDYPNEERVLREETAKSFSSAEVEVGIVSVPPAPFGGLGPAEIQLVAPYYHAGYLQAEREGYDAAVPLGTLDLGVDGGRSLVDIPIIGPCEAMFHIAAQLGERFGVVCYHESVIPRQITQTRYYGMEPWIAGRRASGFKLKDIGANKDVMIKNFMTAARSLIDQDGADVILVHGITQCPVHLKPDWLSRELGVPVVEGIGAPIRMAALMAGLGLKHSRKRWPKSSARPNV
jgi:allantoin racemase